MTIEEIKEEYRRLCHAMQSGVAAWMNYDPSETSPKHLRVGINSAMSDIGAITRLLIEKRIFDEREYAEAIRDGMQREVESYESLLRERLGSSVRLG